ncbi:MAG: UbiX family flavin prenyltransferase [Phycisphaerales bacterium]|nr:UbiX family flavin prenyltransferase [Phycisphaerales bacterium]
MNHPGGGRIVVGVTGASGAAYARRLIQCLVEGGVEVHLIASTWGRRVAGDELGTTRLDVESLLGGPSDQLHVHSNQSLNSRLASGSFLTDGMVICPCSSHTLGSIAAGGGDSLLTRAAAVTLKEARRLILVHREMPLSRIDLLNMLRVNEAGAIVCPASPGFYMLPKRVEDLVDFVVGKILDLLTVPHRLNTRWMESPPADTDDGN